MAPSSASTTHNVATAVTTCSLFTPPAASAMSSSFFAQPEMQVTIKPEVTTAVAATALPPTQQGFSLSVSSCGGDSVTQSSSITSLSASSSHSALYTSSISPTKKYTKDPKSIPCKGEHCFKFHKIFLQISHQMCESGAGYDKITLYTCICVGL